MFVYLPCPPADLHNPLILESRVLCRTMESVQSMHCHLVGKSARNAGGNGAHGERKRERVEMMVLPGRAGWPGLSGGAGG